MIIVADENIPRVREALGGFGEVRLRSGRSISRDDLADADILIVRSITSVNGDLLAGTPVRFVGTATNGIDHVDLGYLSRSGIGFASAIGGNATAVAEYVVAGLLELRQRGVLRLAGETLGIIGVGNVGSRLAPRARALGLRTVEYDPPRAALDPEFRSASFDELFDCDILSLHVPLVAGGDHPTDHLVDARFLERLRRGSVLVNSSRGSVADSDALVAALRSGAAGAALLDVWEGEPGVPRHLIEAAAIATPHIAAYSYDAKLRGTEMMADAVARLLGAVRGWSPAGDLPAVPDPIVIAPGTSPLDAARQAVLRAYDITIDDRAVRDLLPLDDAARRAGFDRLRKEYRTRREFSAYTVVSDDPAVREVAGALGFGLR